MLAGLLCALASALTGYSKVRPAKGVISRQTPPQSSQCSNLKNAPAIFGITITKLEQSPAAHQKLRELAAINPDVPLVVRVLFDPIQTVDATAFETKLNEYLSAVRGLRNSTGACVMGAIADSDYMHFYVRQATDPTWPDGYGNYLGWTRRLVQKMGDAVDIWEVGNEVNGEWYGWAGNAYKKDENEEDQNQDPLMKGRRAAMRLRIKDELDAAYGAIKSLRPDALTAITLLYNDDGKKDCTEFHEYKMNDWAGAYLTERIRGGVDFALLSYYENKQDCAQVTRSPDKLLSNVFVPLRRLFGSDKTAFGFGEVSYKQDCYQNKNDEYDDDDRNNHPKCRAGQREYVTRYYEKLDRDLGKAFVEYNQKTGVVTIKYVGGYFYWYFLQDMVLADTSGENTVYNALRSVRRSFRPVIPPKKNK